MRGLCTHAIGLACPRNGLTHSHASSTPRLKRWATITVTDILTQHVKVSDQASNCRVGDETVILHAGNGTYFGLDAVGSQIWQLLQQGLTPVQFCAQIARDFDVPLVQVEQDARLFLDELTRHDIIHLS